MFKNVENKIKQNAYVQKLISITKARSLPGLGGVPVYYVGTYFTEAISKGTLNTRAASLAFNFFIAIFPGILFLFSLIPFIPIKDVLDILLEQIEAILPASVKPSVMETIHDLIHNEREGFLFFNIALTLYFASNGIVNLMTQFNNTYLFQEKRVWWKQRLIAIVLIIILTILILTGVILIIFTESGINLAIKHGALPSINWALINVTRWIIVFALFYFSISFLYYLGPAKRRSWRFFSAGSSVATVLILLSSIGFSYYITHFSQYNAIYGSIGTIIIIMIYFQLNSYILLLGFELNASIRKGLLANQPTESIEKA